MKTLRLSVCLIATFVSFSIFAFAQGGPGMGSPQPDLDPVFMKLFSSIKGFSADTSITLVQGDKPEPISIESTYDYTDGNLRVDMDLTKMKGPDMPAEAIAQLEMMGMSKAITITRTKEATVFMIYPGLKAYAETKTPSLKAEPAKGVAAKLESSELGQETIDGHPCVKKKVSVKDAGKTHELLVWSAKDLKDFPIQIKAEEDGVKVTILFRNIKTEAPAASRFEVPSGYTRYTDVQTLMQTEMMKKMSSGAMPGTGQ